MNSQTFRRMLVTFLFCAVGLLLTCHFVAAQTIIPQIKEDFSNGPASAWEVFDDMGATGTFSSATSAGRLAMSASGGDASWPATGVRRTFPNPTNFVVSVVLSGTFGGTIGNKRIALYAYDHNDNYYFVQIGKDWTQTPLKGQMSRTNLGNTAAAGTYVDGTPVVFTIMKMGDNIKVFMDGALILSETSQIADLSKVGLELHSVNGADPFGAWFDDFVVLAGE